MSPHQVATGELHLVSVFGRCSRLRLYEEIQSLLRRLRGEWAPDLARDAYGRFHLDGQSIGVSAGPARTLIALAGGMDVAISEHHVPPSFDSAVSHLFSPREQSFVEAAPRDARARLMSQLWVRKEAALRLSGFGRLAMAAEVDAVKEDPEGTVAVPCPGDPRGSFTAYVHDLIIEPDAVAAAATSAPVEKIVTSRMDL
jgi:hypothetical protein